VSIVEPGPIRAEFNDRAMQTVDPSKLERPSATSSRQVIGAPRHPRRPADPRVDAAMRLATGLTSKRLLAGRAAAASARA
jgi:hypothetical protein